MRAIGARDDAFAWMNSRTGWIPSPTARAIKAVDDGGNIRGVVVFNSWTKTSVQAHMAVDTPIAWRRLVVPCFDYVFNQVGKRVLLALLPSDNARAMQLCESLGFRQAYAVRDGQAEGVDLVLFEMRREECRWLKEEKSNG
jgi:hypothetical protein